MALALVQINRRIFAWSFLSIFPLGFVVACSGPPIESGARGEGVSNSAGDVRIDVDLTSPVRRMRGGMGASWHAIEKAIPERHGGSGWGANPPADDDAAWEQIYRHAEWLGLDWCRVELEQRMYEPARGRFDWDNAEMRILYRILDYCQRRGVDVFLTQMWGNVAWNTFPEWRDDPVKRVHSGPLSMDDFAQGYAALVEYLVKTKGYTCIRWLCINNEPGHGWSWWQKPPNEPMSITPGLAAVRRALDAKGLNVPLSGPDWTDLPPLEPQKIDFDPYIGAYDIHTYYAHFDGRKGGYPMAQAIERLTDWANWAHARGKPLFLSEMGTMVFGWKENPPGPATYEACLKDAEMVVRGIGAGVDAFNRWSFINRGDLDGHWQLIETWDRANRKLRAEIKPFPNGYFVYGILPRFTAKHSDVLRCAVDGGSNGQHQRVFAAALRSPKGNLTLAVVNDAAVEWDAALRIRGLTNETRLYRYQLTPADRDRADLAIAPNRETGLQAGAARITDRLPALSVTVYTTYKRAHTEPGIIVD